MALSSTFDLTIGRTTEPENDDADVLSFDIVVHATLDGSIETDPLTGGPNLGVPIRVVMGGAACAG